MPRAASAARARTAVSHLGPNLGLHEDPDQIGVDVLILDLESEDIERLLEGHGALIGSIAGGERVEDVADAHHLRLKGDLLGTEAVRIPGAVEPFVVRASDDGDAA